MKIIFALTIVSLTCFGSYAQSTIQTKWLTDSKGKKLKKEAVTETDSKGNIIRSGEPADKGLCQIFKYEYRNGLILRKISSGCTPGRSEYTIYFYDNSGRVTQTRLYDDKNHLQNREVNTYIGAGKNIFVKESYNGTEKEPYLKSTFEYYPNNLLKKEVQTSEGSWFGTFNYKYDNDKHLVYEDGSVDGGVGVVKTYYTYQNGVLIKDVVHVPDTGMEYHIYETKQVR